MSLPIIVDPSSKRVSVDDSFYEGLPEEEAKDLSLKLEQLNTLHRALVGVNGDVPPPSDQISGPLTTQVNKLRESGIQSLRQNKNAEAVKHLSLAIEMSLRRNPWEATKFLIDELAKSMGPRADAYIAQNMWPEAYNDAAMLTLLAPLDAKNHYRKGRCLQSVQKYSEAKASYAAGLSLSPMDSELKQALAEVSALE
uniref:ARAD1B06072p n=1 Tax=Blastobotrys adeninivorans TaxID=409370 RepID=A0A060T5R7_BLAAD